MAALPNLRRGIGNRVTTSLSASVTDAALTMTVSDATGMSADGGYIMIDEEYSNKREIVYVESITSNTLTISTSGRGLAGTTAVSHDSGATVTDIVVDENVNGIIDTFLVGHSDAGVHVIPNNTAITAKESGGTARDIIKVTSGNILQVGYSTLPMQTIGKWDGWNSIGDTWTYASATTITVPAGAATYYAVGDKIKLTQSATVKYFYIVTVADELLTITGGTDYTLANEAISDVYVSKTESPVGFPARFTWSPTWTASGSMTISSVTNVLAEFVITNGVVEFWISATFTLGGTTSSQVRYTLPVSSSVGDNSSIANGDMYDGAVDLSHGLWSNSGFVYAQKTSAGNWTLGSARVLRMTGKYYYV